MEAQTYLPQHRHIAISVYEVLENPGNLHLLIRDRMAYRYLHNPPGWQLLNYEHELIVQDFLVFVEFVFDEERSVPIIFRAHDLYTVGHLRADGHAFLLVQERKTQMRRTFQCLRHYGISHTIMHFLGDSYPAMEAVAGIPRADLPIGRDGLWTALTNLLVDDPCSNTLNISFSYLFLCMFVCEGGRILYVRDFIITNFAGLGRPVPPLLLQYLYGWSAASYVLDAYAKGDDGPLDYIDIIANFGKMGFWDMTETYDLIKQALAPHNGVREIDMMASYNATVDQFYNNMDR